VHEGSKKAIVAAFLANLAIAVAKFVGFVFTGAASLLAEAIHSFADTGNQGLLMVGGRRAAKPADSGHPFGYGARRYLFAFLVALVLFSIGGLFAIFEAIEKLQHPHKLENEAIAIAILLFAIVAEGLSFRTALAEARKVRRPGRSLFQFIRHTKNAELPVVILEDFAALTGLGFALSGVVIAMLTDEPRWDALGSLMIGLLLVLVAILLAVEMSSLLLGESAAPEDVAAIRGAITSHPAVLRVIHLRTEHVGPDEIIVAAKVEFDHELTLERVADIVDEVEVRIRAAVPAATLIFIEPDVYRPEAAAT
jgi:cation diffusion facilitator family transporter